VPGEKYRLRYRLVVFDGEMTAGKAGEFWKSYTEN
jgi:hypothetical protein